MSWQTFYLDEHKYGDARTAIYSAMEATPWSNTDQGLEAKGYLALGRLDTAKGALDDAAKNLALAEVANDQFPAVGTVAVDILMAQADLSMQRHELCQAKEYYSEAADRLEKMLGAHHPRVEKLRALAAL